MVKQGYKKTEVGVIPEDWESVALLSKCDLLNGLTYTPNDMADNGLLVIRSSNVQNNQLVFSDNVYVDLTVADEKLIKKDDIIICVRNGSAALIGKCAKASRDYTITFGAFMAVLRGENNGYIYQLLQQGTIQKHISKNSGATINQITNGDFKTIFVPFPTDAKEQECIAEALSDVDSMISSLEKLIAKKKAVKQGSMQELLTGQKRLPGFTGEWMSILFKDIYEFAKEGGTPSTSNVQYYHNGKIPFIKIEHLFSKYIEAGKEFITEEGLNNSSAWLIPTESIIFSNGATIGEISINKIPVSTKQGILGIIPKELFSTEFLFYYLSHQMFLNSVKSVTTHGTMDVAYLKDMNNILLYVPKDKKEQIAIATCLADIDNEIEVLEQKLAKTGQIKQGMMQQLLTGKIRLV